MRLVGIDIVTGKVYENRYRNSARVTPVQEPIKSTITEYHLIDLTKEADGDTNVLVQTHGLLGNCIPSCNDCFSFDCKET